MRHTANVFNTPILSHQALQLKQSQEDAPLLTTGLPVRGYPRGINQIPCPDAMTAFCANWLLVFTGTGIL